MILLYVVSDTTIGDLRNAIDKVTTVSSSRGLEINVYLKWITVRRNSDKRTLAKKKLPVIQRVQKLKYLDKLIRRIKSIEIRTRRERNRKRYF